MLKYDKSYEEIVVSHFFSKLCRQKQPDVN